MKVSPKLYDNFSIDKNMGPYPKMFFMIIACFGFMQIASAQYSYVEAFKERQIGYVPGLHSRSKQQFLLKWENYVLVYQPKLTNCEQWFFLHENQATSPKSHFWNYIYSGVCIYCGQNRLIMQHQHTRNSLNHVHDYFIPYFDHSFFRYKARSMYTATTVGDNWMWEGYFNNIDIVISNISNIMMPVAWHYVAGTGPGWIDLRFSVPHPQPHTSLTYRVLHWRHSEGQDPPYTYESLTPNLFMSWREVMARAKPPLPCPEWKTYDIYCVLLTAHVNPLHFTGMNFTDYGVEILTIGLKARWALRTFSNLTYNQIDTELFGRLSKPYIFVVRVWENYDTTTDGFPKLLRSFPFHKEWTKEPKVKGIWANNNSNLGVIGLNLEESATSAYDYNDTAEYEDIFGFQGTGDTFVMLWPFLLFLLLLLLLVVLPLVMFLTRRTRVREEMKKWEHWRSGKENVVFAARRPANAPRVESSVS